MALEFEWDARKDAANLSKSFEEAATVFGDPLGRILADLRRSLGEKRFVLLGVSSGQRLLAVMFTDRQEAIRIISARRATRSEWRSFEEDSK